MDFGGQFVTILAGVRTVYPRVADLQRARREGQGRSSLKAMVIKVLEVDKQGCIRLSMKAVAEGEGLSVEDRIKVPETMQCWA